MKNLFSFFLRRRVVAGLQESAYQDISSFVMVAREAGGLRVIPYFCMGDGLLAHKWNDGTGEPLLGFIRAGCIDVLTGNVLHEDFMGTQAKKLAKSYSVKCVALDRWGSARTAQNIQKKGFKVALVGMGYASLSAPSKEFRSLLLENKILCDNPAFFWMIDNLTFREDPAGNIKPEGVFTRPNGSISGVVAAIMALSLLE